MNMMSNQKGFSLLMTMLLFVALTVVGLAIMRSGILSEKQAINIQEKSVTFHAAQSANNAVLGSLREDIVVWNNAIAVVTNTNNNFRNHNTGYKTCIDGQGKPLATCTTSFESGISAYTRTFYRGCADASLCQGYSAGAGAGIKCHAVELVGTGFLDYDNDGVDSADDSKTNINQWATTPLASCL
ncbi:hypothetical protein [Kangiella sp. TOML190]|uniref:pilus assembly PilX family protein n=1 Tax=Kangiella sp. TOML190 TaxID=2931351 RepID=UPI0020412E90|nr:hypothetical protein [Kangiella sp. TOML190]